MSKPSTEGCVLLAIVFVFSLVFGLITHGYVLSILWRWFMVPTFHLPPLAIPQALGLGVIVGMFKTHSAAKTKDSPEVSEVIVKILSEAFLSPALSLLFGWIVLQFMK